MARVGVAMLLAKTMGEAAMLVEAKHPATKDVVIQDEVRDQVLRTAATNQNQLCVLSDQVGGALLNMARSGRPLDNGSMNKKRRNAFRPKKLQSLNNGRPKGQSNKSV